MRRPLIILGTGSFASEVADLAEETGEYEVTAFLDDRDLPDDRRRLLDRPVLGLEAAARLAATHRVVCALGTTRRQALIERVAAAGCSFATIIHPRARLSGRSSAGEGCILSAGVIVGAYTNIGRHVTLNRGSLVGHHTRIGDYATISPGANIAASVRIGEAAYVGMGAVVLDHLSIGPHSVIGAGAVVTRDVPGHVKVMGVPAKVTGATAEGL